MSSVVGSIDDDNDALLLLLAWFLVACDPRNGSMCSAV